MAREGLFFRILMRLSGFIRDRKSRLQDWRLNSRVRTWRSKCSVRLNVRPQCEHLRTPMCFSRRPFRRLLGVDSASSVSGSMTSPLSCILLTPIVQQVCGEGGGMESLHKVSTCWRNELRSPSVERLHLARYPNVWSTPITLKPPLT